MDEDISLFWERVNALIKARGTKQETLAQNCGINYQTLRGWVVHKTYPNAKQTYLIAKELGTSVEYLVTGIQPDKDAEIAELRKKILSFALSLQ